MQRIKSRIVTPCTGLLYLAPRNNRNLFLTGLVNPVNQFLELTSKGSYNLHSNYNE